MKRFRTNKSICFRFIKTDIKKNIYQKLRMLLCIYIMLDYIINFTESGRKETKKKVHEEVIAEDYDNTKEEINQIDISQKFMVSMIAIN